MIDPAWLLEAGAPQLERTHTLRAVRAASHYRRTAYASTHPWPCLPGRRHRRLRARGGHGLVTGPQLSVAGDPVPAPLLEIAARVLPAALFPPQYCGYLGSEQFLHKVFVPAIKHFEDSFSRESTPPLP